MSAQIPREGREAEAILSDLEAFRKDDARWRDGKVFSLVYDAGPAHAELLKRAHNLYFSENGLNPMAFKSLRRMEAEVVRMSANMLSGGPETVGTMTSGGTESILLAVKAARVLLRPLARRSTRPGRGAPSCSSPRARTWPSTRPRTTLA